MKWHSTQTIYGHPPDLITNFSSSIAIAIHRLIMIHYDNTSHTHYNFERERIYSNTLILIIVYIMRVESTK